MSSLEIDENNGRTVFWCEECQYSQEVPGMYLVAHDLAIAEEVAAKPRILPERQVICPVCSADQAYYYQMQTRSADEPMTIFNTCVACKHSWRE